MLLPQSSGEKAFSSLYISDITPAFEILFPFLKSGKPLEKS